MPRRKEFKGVTRDLVSMLSSRNNDYSGYWAIGQLCSFAQERNITSVNIKIHGEVESTEEILVEDLRLKYSTYLSAFLEIRGMPKAWIKAAWFGIHFTTDHEKNHLYWGEPQHMFRCSIAITTDLDRRYASEKLGYCVSHNPQKESCRL